MDLNRTRRCRRRLAMALLVALAVLAHASSVAASAVAPRSIVLASTTSTEQSGLFGHLLPRFRAASGIDVRVVAVGTGQALDIARRGDADALLVHDAAAEQRFVAEGFARDRRAVMYNDFVLVGPAADPARTRGADITGAMQRLAGADATFVSRADGSGTHAMEQRLWAAAGASGAAQRPQRPQRYRECGCGMGPALNMAAALSAYTLADRATWLAFRNRAELAVLVQGDRRLFNPYSVLVVSRDRHPHVKHELATAFADWLVSPAGQQSIADFRVAGELAFFPDAAR